MHHVSVLGGLAFGIVSMMAPGGAQSQEFHGATRLVEKTIEQTLLSSSERARLQDHANSLQGRDALRTFLGTKHSLGHVSELQGGQYQFRHVVTFSRETGMPLDTALELTTAGMNAAAQYATARQISLTGLRTMTRQEYSTFTSDAYQARLVERGVIPTDQTAPAQILPVSIEGQPLIYFPFENGGVNLARLVPRDGQSGTFSVGPRVDGGGRISDRFQDNGVSIAHLDVDTFGTMQRRPQTKPKTQCGADSGTACFLSAVTLHNAGAVRCSGVQVSPGWVLTAAHCVCQQAPQLASIGQVTPNRHGIGVFNPVIVPGSEGIIAETDTAAIEATRYFFGETPGAPSRNMFCEKHRRLHVLPRPS